MLSPSINTANGLLAAAFDEVLHLDGYAVTASNTVVGVLPKDPTWLTPVRNRLALLAAAGTSWIADKPDIWAPVLVQFADYAASFAGVAQQQAKGTVLDSAAWVALLDGVLLTQLKTCIVATDTAATALQAHYQSFKNIQPLLESSINAGWAALADEEQQMVAIATALTHLQDVAASLESSITAADITTGKSVVQTTVTTLYGIATAAGTSFSFIGMAGAAFTVGTFYYDLIEKTGEIAATLERIGELQLEASGEAQAAAGTKLILRLLYNLELSFGRITDVLPQITQLWATEGDKVQQAIDALKAGADPSTYFDIQTISVANANWQAISSVALAIPTIKTTGGPPVTLAPQQPVAAAS